MKFTKFILFLVLLISCNRSNSTTISESSISEKKDTVYFSERQQYSNETENELKNLHIVLEKVDYSKIIKTGNYATKFASRTADVAIYENDEIIFQTDFISKDSFIINNNTAIFNRDEKMVFFNLDTKIKDELELHPLPVYYNSIASSNKNDIFYASSYGGPILRFNHFDGIVEKIDENFRWSLFVASFSDGRILSIVTDQSPTRSDNLEIRTYDEMGNILLTTPLIPLGVIQNTEDYYFDSKYNILFQHDNSKRYRLNIYNFNNESVNIKEEPEFGYVIDRIIYNNIDYFVTYYNYKIIFYNTGLEKIASFNINLSTNYEIANIEIIDDVVKIYEYLPGN